MEENATSQRQGEHEPCGTRGTHGGKQRMWGAAVEWINNWDDVSRRVGEHLARGPKDARWAALAAIVDQTPQLRERIARVLLSPIPPPRIPLPQE